MRNTTPVNPPPMTSAERDAINPLLRKIGSIIYNTTTGKHQKWSGSAWADVGGTGTFTALDHLAAPATNSDADQQAFLVALRNDMIAKGMMNPPPTYAVSGQISGAVVSGVALQLVGAQTYNTTSDGAGNFSFPNVENGSYALTPSIAGHWFSPGNRLVTVAGANVTAQNFIANVIVASQETSLNDVLVFGNNTARAVSKSSMTQESSTFAALNSLVYGGCFHDGRYFIPSFSQGTILVYEKVSGVYTLKATLNSSALFGVANPMRVYSNGARLFVINNSSFARFFTYNTATETATALGGAAIYYGVAMLDAAASNNKIYIVSSYGGSPARNLTVIDFDSFAITTFNVPSLAGLQINFISAGGDALLLINSTNNARVVDANTLVQRGPNVTVAATGGRVAYSNGGFFITESTRIIRVDKDNASQFTISSLSPSAGFLFGAVADDSFVYAADNANRLYRISSGSLAQMGPAATITGATNTGYLKN